MVSAHNPHKLLKLMKDGLVSVTGKKEVFLFPNFVSKPAEGLIKTFTHLIIAVSLCVIPPLCVQVQALKYYVKLYP